MAHSYRLKIGRREIAAMEPHTIFWDLAVRGFNASSADNSECGNF